MEKSLSEIKVGDQVWIGDSRKQQRGLATVKRLTPTQIILHHDQRFHRGRKVRGYGSPTYDEVGGTTYGRDRITGIATEQEIADFQAEQERWIAESKARRLEQERVDAKRRELCGLFDDASVREGEGDLWEITLALSEPQLRRLAELVKSLEVAA